jgi:uncharacterized protein
MKYANADFMMKSKTDKALFLSILLAFVLWFVTFIIRPFNFWLMMSINTSLLAAVSFAFGRPLISREELSLKNILLGILAAVLLYFVFRVGNRVLIFISGVLPTLIPDRAGNIEAVYANRGALSPVVVGVLLFFPIGFGEEIFWRGFVQARFSQKWGPPAAFALTTLLYVGVHVPTGNPVLILAAFTCGLFWGGIYMAFGKLVPALVSHMLWDPAIFVMFPIE